MVVLVDRFLVVVVVDQLHFVIRVLHFEMALQRLLNIERRLSLGLWDYTLFTPAVEGLANLSPTRSLPEEGDQVQCLWR